MSEAVATPATPARLGYGSWALITLLFLVVAGATYAADIEPWTHPDAPFGFEDVDVWLRLHRVERLADGAGWFDNRILRSSPPLGVESPWTRPFDVLLLGIAQTIQAFGLERKPALILTTVVGSFLMLLATAAVALRLGRQMGLGVGALMFVGGALLFYPPAYWPNAPGRSDHHGLLLALGLALPACLGPALRRQPRWGWTAGAVTGLGIWVSVEFVALYALALIALTGLWLRGDRLAPAALRALATGTLVTVLVGLLAEQPPGRWLEVEHDSISVVQFTMAAAAWLVTRCVRPWGVDEAPEPGTRRWMRAALRRLALPVAVALAGLIMLQLLSPGFYAGPMAQTSAYMREHFLPHIGEMQSRFLQMPWLDWIGFFFFVQLGLLPLMLVAPWRRLDPLVVTVLVMAAGLALLGLFQQRWMNYGGAFAVLATGYWIGSWRLRPIKRAALLTAMLILPACIMQAADRLLPPAIADFEAQRSACSSAERRMIQADTFSQLLPDRPVQRIAISPDRGADVLFWTPHGILASNYHREEQGFRDLNTLYRTSDPAAAAEVLNRNQIDLWLVCEPQLQPTGREIAYRLPDEPLLHGVVRLTDPAATPPGAPTRMHVYRVERPVTPAPAASP